MLLKFHSLAISFNMNLGTVTIIFLPQMTQQLDILITKLLLSNITDPRASLNQFAIFNVFKCTVNY